MSRALKRIKDYERWVLIGLVIILLATFSVTGVVRGCSGPGPLAEDLGGSYEATPGRRVDVSDEEFRIVRARYAPFYLTEGWGPSVRYGGDLAGTDRRGSDLDVATWNHIATVGAATAAGYAVGDQELVEGIEEMVIRAFPRRAGMDPRTQGMRFTPELYDQVIGAAYRGTKADFERTVREILLKDKFLGGLVDAQRYATDREAAFEQWKASRERVDLGYLAVETAPFAQATRLVEETRSAIASAAQGTGRLVQAAYEGVRRLQDAATTWKAAHEGRWPADAAELVGQEPGKRLLPGGMPKDPWGHEYAYAVQGDAARVASAGPDGEFGTGDDVDAATYALLSTLPALRRAGDALLTWRKATGSWPSSLSDLVRPPPVASGQPALPAPLAEVVRDGWGRELVWDAAGPTLLSLGPDGERGSPDDLAAVVAEAKVRVPAPAVLAAHAGPGAKDAWGRPLALELRSPNPVVLGASSPGADGVEGTADDVLDGNGAHLRDFYQRVRGQFTLPLRREFEALYVIPALVPDATFAAAWARFPDLRPTEKEAWDLFRSSGIYTTEEGTGASAVAIDAADPKKGYAAALLEDLRAKGRLPAQATGWPVPSAESLGDRKDPPASTPGGLPSPEADPLYKTYLEKGWRRVVLRDLFFEKALDATLVAARKAAEERKAWEAKGRAGPEPAAVTFAARLAEWADLQPSEADSQAGARFVQYFATEAGKPLTREELEKLPDLGDYTLSTALGSLDDGELASIPTLLRDGALRAALRGVKRHDPREPDLEEVRDQVWPRYLEDRALDRAVSELTTLRAEVEKAIAAAQPAPTPQEKVATFERLAAQAAAAPGVVGHLERTGMFVGAAASAARTPTWAADATDAEKAAARRRAFVRRFGYDEVRAARGAEQTSQVVVGQMGRQILRDTATGADATGCAYLVQVAAHAYPSREEFHGAEYLSTIARDAYDLPEWYPAQVRRGLPVEGRMTKLLESLYDDGEAIRRDFAIQRNRPPKPRDAARPTRP